MIESVRLSVLLIAFFAGCTPSSPTERYRLGGSYGGASPVLSCDGTEVIFSTPEFGNGDILRYSCLSHEFNKVISSPKYEGEPHVNCPKGLLAFVRETPAGMRIFTYDLTARVERQITYGPGDDINPSFSDDGTQMLFARFQRKSTNYPANIVLINLETGEENVLTDDHFDRSPHFAGPDSIIFVRDLGRVYTLGLAKGEEPKKLCEGYQPVYDSTTGSYLVLSARLSKTRNAYELLRVSISGEVIGKLTNTGGYKSNLNMSPSGHFVYLQEPDRNGLGIVFKGKVDSSTQAVVDLRNIDLNR